MHDTRVLRLSRLFDAAENDLILVEPTVDVNGTSVRPLIVDDSAYPLKEGLLCPFKDNGALTREQKTLMRSYREPELLLNVHMARQREDGGFYKKGWTKTATGFQIP